MAAQNRRLMHHDHTLRLHHIHVHHAGAAAPALAGVDLVVDSGKLLVLLGPSGCGKSTLLRVVAGLQTVQQGRVSLHGLDITPLPASQRPVSLVFQQYALFPHLSVLANVAYGLAAAGVSPASAAQRASAALALVGLPDVGQRAPGTLSGGQQQRVALARALVLEPAVLLLDEPLSNLDEALRRSVRQDIRSLQQRLGLTVLYVTHDQAEAMAVADHLALLRDGHLVQLGTPRQLYEEPAHAWVAGFMGDALMFDTRLDASGQRWLGPLKIKSAGETGPRTGPTTAPAPGPATGQRCQAVVRPHAWRIGPPRTTGLAGRVLRCTDLGRVHELLVATDLGELLVQCPRAARPHEVGAPVSLHVADEGVVLVPH
jgi:iron(III) transport system ATP-binding protein